MSMIFKSIYGIDKMVCKKNRHFCVSIPAFLLPSRPHPNLPPQAGEGAAPPGRPKAQPAPLGGSEAWGLLSPPQAGEGV